MCQIQRNEASEKRHGSQGLQVQTEEDVLEAEMDGLPADVSFPVDDIKISDQHRKRSTTAPLDSDLYCKVQKIGEEVTDAVTALVNKKAIKNHVTIESAIETLQAIPDVDEELLLDACDLLEDERKAKTFMALDATLRKKWLLRKLRPQESSQVFCSKHI